MILAAIEYSFIEGRTFITRLFFSKFYLELCNNWNQWMSSLDLARSCDPMHNTSSRHIM